MMANCSGLSIFTEKAMKPVWIFLLLVAGPLGAQNSWQISGYVRNEDREALPGSLVQVNDSTGVVADASGFFQFETPYRPQEMTVRCLGYFPGRVVVAKGDFRDGKARVDVTLTSQETPLTEVSITAKKVEVLARENFQTDIFDYTFAGENLLLLVRERKSWYARLVTESGELLDQIKLDGRPTLLHRSCTGSLHLVGEAFAQELTVRATRLDTFARYPLEKFRQFVAPCVQQSRGYFFFRINGLFNQSVTYVYFDPERRRRLLAVIRDQAGEEEAMTAYKAFRTGEPLFLGRSTNKGAGEGFGMNNAQEPENIFSDAALQQYANSNEQLAHWSWLQVLKQDSVYAPLLKSGDTLLLFDHLHDELKRFDVRLLADARAIPIRYHHEKGWKKELLQDEASRAIYAHFADNRGHRLCRIGTDAGNVLAEYALPEVPLMAQRMKVRNGFLYFLGRAVPGEPNNNLYKVHIAQKSASK